MIGQSHTGYERLHDHQSTAGGEGGGSGHAAGADSVDRQRSPILGHRDSPTSMYSTSQPQRHSPLANHVFMASELSDCDSDLESAAAASAYSARFGGLLQHHTSHPHYYPFETPSQRVPIPDAVPVAVHPSFRRLWNNPEGAEGGGGDHGGLQPRRFSIPRPGATESATTESPLSYYEQAVAAITNPTGMRQEYKESFLRPSSTLSGHRKQLPTPPASTVPAPLPRPESDPGESESLQDQYHTHEHHQQQQQHPS
ncbi:hypothetical protein BJ085DRAFT_35866, partial [Dimargaris cristalligena]